MVPAAVGAIAPRCARSLCGGAPLPTGAARSGGDDERGRGGVERGYTEERNDEPRRGSKNRRAFRETTAAVGERREEDLGGG